jgi:hypothetical protein
MQIRLPGERLEAGVAEPHMLQVALVVGRAEHAAEHGSDTRERDGVSPDDHRETDAPEERRVTVAAPTPLNQD